MAHIPVMLKEVVEILDPKKGELYLDCTFGAGGYTRAILNAGAEVVAIDRDPGVKQYADALYLEFPLELKFVNSTFANTKEYFDSAKPFDGIVLDLGVSSMQLDQAARGFSFMYEGELDMRMGQYGKSAKDLVNHATEEELANIIFKYGDEIASRRIARAIANARVTQEITTTLELAEIVRKAIGHRGGKIDPATKTFQAIRIWVNDELTEIEEFLEQVEGMLKVGGKLIVVTFHSLEDKIIKEYLSQNTAKKVARSKYSHLSKLPSEDQGFCLYDLLNKKPLVPSDAEVKANPRSRSAKLRSAIKRERAA